MWPKEQLHVFWKAWRTCSGCPASFPLCWSSWRITGRWRFPGFKVLKKTPIYTVQRKIVKTTLVGEHVGIIFCCRKGDFSPCVLGCLGERLLQEPSYRICTCVRWVWWSSWKWRLALGWVFCSCQKQGYYKQCCDEHWGTRVSFPSGFLHNNFKIKCPGLGVWPCSLCTIQLEGWYLQKL